MRSDLYRCSVHAVALAMMLVAFKTTTAQDTSRLRTQAGPETLAAPIADVVPARRQRPLTASETPARAAKFDLATLDRLHWPLLRQDLKVSGAMSCATSNCHGGPRVGVSQPSAPRGMEFQLWLENDPHAQSWRTICSDESVSMMERLGIIKDGDVVDRTGFDNCLACHNSVRRFDEPRRNHVGFQGNTSDLNTFLREGVGCAGCHGPSERWISTHFQNHWSPQTSAVGQGGWGQSGRGDPHDNIRHAVDGLASSNVTSGVLAGDQGFVQASDLYVRARMCAACHVGDQDRDMNHDLIAAGHPTLRYELATFHSWLPKHWRDSEVNDRTSYEAQLWLAGQVASADASLAMLQARAEKALPVSTWPEFAAYNCASCHHNLGLDNQRVSIEANRKALAIYSQWHDSGLRWLIQFRIDAGQATEQDLELLAALDAVKQAMETKPRPAADRVAELSHQARLSLARWLDGTPGRQERSQFRSDRLGHLVASAAGNPSTYRSWESAAQFYLAAVASRESWPGGWHGPVRELADRMQTGLRYPEMIDISRFEQRTSGPTATREQTMQMAMELAGWLGTVEPGKLIDEDQAITESMRASLRDTIERINRQRSRLTPPASSRDPLQPDRDKAELPPVNPPPVNPPPVTREQLLEQMRQRRDARERDNPDREPSSP